MPNGYNVVTGGNNSTHLHKLKEYNDIEKIRQLLSTTNLTNIEIGKQFGVSDQTISDINTGRIWFDTSIQYPIRKAKANYCKNCGTKLQSLTKTGLCRNCYNIFNSSHIPNRNVLKDLIRDKSFVSIGQQFNVSDNAVRKWCKKYNLPYTKKEILQYSDQEWLLL